MALSSWYALQVYTGKEKWVTTALEERCHQTLLLLYCSVHRWSDRNMRIDRPVFPGYVFCNLQSQQQRTSILSTPGVLTIVGAGRTPLPLDQEEISALMRIADAKWPVSPASHLCEGDRVVIRGGALEGVTGTLVRYGTGLRVTVSVSLLERAVSLEIDVGRLEKIAPSDNARPGPRQLPQDSLVPEPSLPVKRFCPPHRDSRRDFAVSLAG